MQIVRTRLETPSAMIKWPRKLNYIFFFSSSFELNHFFSFPFFYPTNAKKVEHFSQNWKIGNQLRVGVCIVFWIDQTVADERNYVDLKYALHSLRNIGFDTITYRELASKTWRVSWRRCSGAKIPVIFAQKSGIRARIEKPRLSPYPFPL